MPAVNMMPLFHVGGIVRNLLAPMMTGGSTIMCSGFDAIAFWNLSLELKATWYEPAFLKPPRLLIWDSGIMLHRLFTTPFCLPGQIPSYLRSICAFV